MKNRNVLGRVVKSILISATVSLITGILFAPDKGSETRKKISKKGKEFSDMTRDEFEEFINYTRKKYEEAKKQADNYVEKWRS